MKKYLIVLLVVVLVIIGAGVVYSKLYKPLVTVPNQVACTMEAKICPDGSSVGRQGPNCEFAECPLVQAVDETADWKTYKSEKYGFEVKYPQDWKNWSSSSTRFAFGKTNPIQRDGYDGELFITIYKSSEKNTAEIIAGQEEHEKTRFGNSVITKNPILVAGEQGVMLIVNNSELQKNISSWVYKIIILEHNGQTYVLSNGAMDNSNFENFYKSFQFTQ